MFLHCLSFDIGHTLSISGVLMSTALELDARKVKSFDWSLKVSSNLLFSTQNRLLFLLTVLLPRSNLSSVSSFIWRAEKPKWPSTLSLRFHSYLTHNFPSYSSRTFCQNVQQTPDRLYNQIDCVHHQFRSLGLCRNRIGYWLRELLREGCKFYTVHPLQMLR